MKPPPLLPDSPLRWLKVLPPLLLGMGAGFVVLLMINPGGGWVPVCPFRTWLDWPCPFCGGTRAWACLSQGQWVEAVAYNPLAVILVPTLLAWFGVWLWDTWTGRDCLTGIYVSLGQPGILKVFMGLILLNWVYVSLFLPGK